MPDQQMTLEDLVELLAADLHGGNLQEVVEAAILLLEPLGQGRIYDFFEECDSVEGLCGYLAHRFSCASQISRHHAPLGLSLGCLPLLTRLAPSLTNAGA